ncbi:MAG TPA: exopolysaccharide biosynthesis protein [Thermodesulfobacteriota bacterium]|nr:exopolysaccharide biosynthesis protein [Thermodesulfobacteriota bacterium]
MILKLVGRRSFGPLLLVAGLVTLLPIICDIPGVPTIMGIFVLLIAGQLLFRREHLWLPCWMLNRSVPRDKLRKS